MEDFNNKTILITGGTGSFGKSFAKYLLANYNLKKLIIFSRDERKQFQMQQQIDDKRIRFFIGDVRDLQRLQRAFNGVDIVVHAAALKQIPILEYNPFEAVKTNVLGSQNVIDAAIDQVVKKVLLVSTDKAAHPNNLYGATKLCAEKLFINGNVYAGNKTKFSCVRYGNVIGSRGSIIETLLRSRDSKKVFITDNRMTRFWITLGQSHELVKFGIENMEGAEIYVPKVPVMKLVDLFKAIVPHAEREEIGIRPGEKLHEDLITNEESRRTVDLGDYYVILPEADNLISEERYAKYFNRGNNLADNFRFSSGLHDQYLSKEELLEIIKDLEI